MTGNRRVNVVYCDEIRHEVGGKLIMVGVYGNDLMVESFPIVLPILSIWTRFIHEAGISADSFELSFCIDGESQSTQVFENDPDHESLDGDASGALVVASTIARFRNLQIESGCRLSMRASVDGEEYESLTLGIRAGDPEAS